MSKIITNPKNYSGEELTNIFFRPILKGTETGDLGIRVLYNMPTPTTLGFWGSTKDVLKSYTKGWQGGAGSEKFQKTLEMKKVKAEMSYSAADYFSMVYEKLACTADTNMTDLSGTELETAETEIFKNSIKESLRTTLWAGNTDRTGAFNTFDGIIKRVILEVISGEITHLPITLMTTAGNAEKLMSSLWEGATPALRALKNEGNLVFFATSDVVDNYERSLYSGTNDSARLARMEGIDKLMFRGIPVEDMGVSDYLPSMTEFPDSLIILTDRRNITLAINTRDLPGSEVAMWYNPDELENRQRATFLAAADILLPELLITSYSPIA